MGYYSDYYRADVRDVVALTPNMIRMVFGGDDLRRFVSSGDPDERLVVVLPRAGEREAPVPVRQDDGSLDYPAEDEPEMRSYTVRRVDSATGEMVIDFVRHEGGAAAGWAIQARAGDVVYLSPANGWYKPPADATWQLLMADMTALPALGRILEELPAQQRAVVLAEVTGPSDTQRIESLAEVTCTWLHGSGNGHGPSRLLAALQEMELPEGPGYIWFAGEAAESREVRKYVRRELGWPTERFTIIGYWRVDKERWMARWEQVGDSLEKVYESAVASGLSENDALEVYEEALEKAGL
ncbi:MAG TPA: siderophore-interacting protein [Microlunatus sp.]|nr:siderophore-interacting protein [Microlunatus sp.]